MPEALKSLFLTGGDKAIYLVLADVVRADLTADKTMTLQMKNGESIEVQDRQDVLLLKVLLEDVLYVSDR